MPKTIQHAVVSKFFSYDPYTGVVVWLSRSAGDFPAGTYDRNRRAASWNTRYAGKPAGADNGSGYLVARLFGENYKVHRIAMCFLLGEDFSGVVDHVNGDRMDNRAANLRAVGFSENARNTHLHRSGTAGVVWYKPLSKWRAQIWADGKNICLGYFDKCAAARDARALGEAEHWGNT